MHDVPEPAVYPHLSVVVAARDEERAVGEAVRSLLAQDYPGPFEVVAVDDRSTDATGAILRSLAASDPRLTVLRVEELPEGWLGKTHAQGLGAGESVGVWILFTDADVRFAPEALRRAVAFAEAHERDHLVLFPEVFSEGVLLRGFVAAFALFFLLALRPWRVRDPKSREFVGVGAFQLVRREAYLASGGHRAVALRPDDDVKLGKVIKAAGFRQDVAFGTGLVVVEWHRSAWGAVRGLEKSIFPGMDYRVGATVLGALVLVLTNVLPFVGVFLGRGSARWSSGGSVALILALYAAQTRFTGARLSFLYGLLHPLSSSLLAYAALRSTRKALRSGGIEWRGTLYPLDELRRNKV